MIVIGVILLVFGIGGFGLYGYKRYLNSERKKPESTAGWFVIALCAFLLGGYLLTGTYAIPAGHRGVVLAWGGEVEQRIAGEGLNFIIPFVETVVPVDVRVQAHPFKDIDAASKEMQTVKMTGNVNWHFDAGWVNTTYQTIGASKDFVDKVLDKALQDFLKEVTPTYTIMEILPKRSEIRARAVEALALNLARYHILIDDIYIGDIQFSVEYLSAIEKQQVAERQINTEKNILEQKRIQADQVKIAAEGQANAMIAQALGDKQAAITRAEGEKQATVIRSEGTKQANITVAQGQAEAINTIAEKQAKANETVDKTLTKQIIEYALVQKLGDDIKVMILPTGQQFILGSEVLGK